MSNETPKKVTQERALEQREHPHLSSQRVITVQEFVDEGIAEKIASGECEVFEVVPPPPQDAPEGEKQAFQYMLLKYGNGFPVNSVEKLGENYYSVNGIGMAGDSQLVLFTKAK